MNLSEGTEVLAKYPNSDDYRKGKIVRVRSDSYKIQFETGAEHNVHASDVRISRPSRSVARASTRIKKSPTRYSPSRKTTGRSPGRSPGRSSRRSPRRSPGRPSSAASKQLQSKSTKLAKVSLPRIEMSNDKFNSDNVFDTKSTKNYEFVEPVLFQSQLKESGTVTYRSARLFSGTLKSEQDHKMVMLTRNINRAVSLPIERKSQLHDFVDGKERGQSVQRDQDLLKTLTCEKDVNLNTQVLEKRKKEINISEPQEWGGWFGSLILIFLLPLSTILPQLMCTQNQCSFGYLDLSAHISSYIHFEAFAAYLGFLLFVAIVSVIPIGRKIDGPQSIIGRLEYRLNGFLCSLLSLVVFTTCIYKEIRIADFIIDNCVQFSVSGWILGLILSGLLFIKGGKAPVIHLNIHASTNSTIYNFWQGREINPRVGPIDFKMCLFRSAMIAMILINLSITVKTVEEVEVYTSELLKENVLLVSLLQITYAIDALFFESAILTTFEIMYEGTGYMLCTGYLIFPFLPTITTKYMLYNRTQLNYWDILPVLTFIIGYLLYRISNLQKDEFRRNSLSPSLEHLETIPTARGKKLIVSGLWGHLRHPNYLGDIMMWWSISCISMACDILSYYYAIVCTILLIHRAIRDNERCKMRYGSAWEQYTSRVKYMILYRIF